MTPLPVTLTSGKIASAPPSCAADADAKQLFDLHEWIGLVACGATEYERVCFYFFLTIRTRPATSQESFQPFVSSYQAADPDSSLRGAPPRLRAVFSFTDIYFSLELCN